MLDRRLISHDRIHRRCIHRKSQDIGSISLQLGSRDQIGTSFLQISESVRRIEVSALDRRADHIDIALCSRHDRVLIQRMVKGVCRDLLNECPPVCHQKAGVLPLVVENDRIQFIVRCTEAAVDHVIDGHDGSRFSFLDRDLEALEIDLTERSLGYDRIHEAAVRLSVIGTEMLDRRGHAVLLEALDLGRSDTSGYQRILGEILEVSAVQRMSVDIDTGP